LQVRDNGKGQVPVLPKNFRFEEEFRRDAIKYHESRIKFPINL